MLPASASASGSADVREACCRDSLVIRDVSSGWRPARNLSTIAAMSSRLILRRLNPPRSAVVLFVARQGPVMQRNDGAGEGAGVDMVEAETAGRVLFTGLVSKATRLISSKWRGETLSEVTLPPRTAAQRHRWRQRC